jgi:hypothetical protein
VSRFQTSRFQTSHERELFYQPKCIYTILLKIFSCRLVADPYPAIPTHIISNLLDRLTLVYVKYNRSTPTVNDRPAQPIKVKEFSLKTIYRFTYSKPTISMTKRWKMRLQIGDVCLKTQFAFASSLRAWHLLHRQTMIQWLIPKILNFMSAGRVHLKTMIDT